MGKKVSRRQFIKATTQAALATSTSTLTFPYLSSSRAHSKPNILMISIDDLNDWIGPLGGYPLVKTPNLDRLAAMSRVYQRAYTNVPACSPSRTTTLFGMQPYTTGVYSNAEKWQNNSMLGSYKSIPKFFKDNGYATYGTGKIFHGRFDDPNHVSAIDQNAWSDYQFCKNSETCRISVVGDGKNPVDSNNNTIYLSQWAKAKAEEKGVTHREDFGAYYKLDEVPDYLRAKWMAENILNKTHSKPFLACCGIYKPHLPFIVPQQFFDMYPQSSITYPPGVMDSQNHRDSTNSDVSDLGPIGRRHNKDTTDHYSLIKSGEWLSIVRAYLACVSFADFCVGQLLDAVVNGPNKNNTIIVLWSDHGWQLGEKLAWRKFTLWERALRVPIMISGPNIKPSGNGLPVSLIDIYPTLTDLAFGNVPAHLEGNSLKNNLLSHTKSHRYVISTWRERENLANEGPHFSIRTENYRLIKYKNGERELYNHRSDPYEFQNLYNSPSNKILRIAENLERFLPKSNKIVARDG